MVDKLPPIDDQVLLQTIAERYLTSGDFNGYAVHRMKSEFKLTTSSAKEAVYRLLKGGKIDVVFGNIHPNPHIKAFSTVPKVDQQKFLEELEFTDHICLYPSSEFLATLPEVELYRNSPFELELALGAGQLDFRVFDLSILEFYRNDPRYYYETDSINGSISITNEHYESEAMPEHDQVLLETFGFAYDDQLNRAVAVFLRYLSKLSPEHQRIWDAKRLNGDYKLHPDYYRNSILGDFGTRISIFDAFTQELKVINAMAILMGRPQLFRNSFADEIPKIFAFLLRPTLAEFNAFVLLLDKMMSDNINKEFFAGQISLEDEIERQDGKVVVSQKGTITLLEEWVRKYFRPTDPKPLVVLFNGFRTVRKLRQKPAHSVNEDIFDLIYFKQQRQLILDAYISVRTLRLLFTNHPKVKENPPEVGEQLERGEIWDI